MKAVFVGGQEHGRVMELNYEMGAIRFPVKYEVEAYGYVGMNDRCINGEVRCVEYLLHRQLTRKGKEDLLVYVAPNYTYEQILAALLNY
ncbi:hypothetical protein [Ralstonia phage Reminis]|uniref:Uncharacterized protein n=1 Tax=Ralstonia phage Reminis TaxID=2662139 RepID=A0A5Q2U8J8_9CAUD|nr:hypothetical protein [Ralstonia phage Reminis]